MLKKFALAFAILIFLGGISVQASPISIAQWSFVQWNGEESLFANHEESGIVLPHLTSKRLGQDRRGGEDQAGTPVPEPATLGLFALGAGLAGLAARRKVNRAA
jgi:PEP-CTERM motif-containing protein